MSRLWVAVALATAVLAAAACGAGSEGPPPDAGQSVVPSPAFVGKTWLSTDPAAAPGTIRVFLADGTLVMDSCFETYRLARWRQVDGRRIEWEEDTARIVAEVDESTPGQLRLRLQLTQELKEEQFRLAPVPFVCPDMQARFTAVVARGNEPFWGIQVDGDVATVRTPEELGGVTYRGGPWIASGPRRWRYSARREAAGGAPEEIALELLEEPCADTMADERFPLRAVLSRNGARMDGCAREGRGAAR